MRLGMEGKIRRVEVKQLSEDTTEWYYGILRATEDRDKYYNRIQWVILGMMLGAILLLFIVKGNVILITTTWMVFYCLYRFSSLALKRRAIDGFASLMQYKTQYNFCGVVEIEAYPWIWGMYPEAVVTFEFEDEMNKKYYMNIRVRRKRDKKVEAPTLCVWDMTLYLTHQMEKEILW